MEVAELPSQFGGHVAFLQEGSEFTLGGKPEPTGPGSSSVNIRGANVFCGYYSPSNTAMVTGPTRGMWILAGIGLRRMGG